MLKKRFKYIDKKPSENLFARYDEARAKLKTVYRVYRLTAYSGNSLYLFEICIYKYTHIYIYKSYCGDEEDGRIGLSS